MSPEQIEAMDELTEIFNELLKLGSKAHVLVTDNFPEELGWVNAYRIFDFGTSVNPYDSTFEKLIENINRREQEDREHEGSEYLNCIEPRVGENVDEEV